MNVRGDILRSLHSTNTTAQVCKSISRDNFNNLVELLRKISSSRYSRLLLMGDFSMRN